MQRGEPLEIDRLLRRLPEAVTLEMVMDSHRQAGQRISGREEPVLVLDALLEGCPIVGASRGFEELTGHSLKAVLGMNWRAVLLEGLGEEHVARSACQDIDSFLRMARLRRIDTMADCAAVLVASRAGGGTFKASLTMRLVKMREWAVAASPPTAAVAMVPGPAPPKPARAAGPGGGQQHLLVLLAVTDLDAPRGAVQKASYPEESRQLGALCELLSEEVQEPWPESYFFPSPLSFKCILLNCVSTGMRREPHQVPRGCILMSAASMVRKAGEASFEIVVERMLPNWASRLPFLGFTCTTPEEVQDDRCFFGPSPHAFCLGQSVTIGGTGEAWLRLEGEPLRPVVGQRLDQGALRKHLTPNVPEHRRCAPLELRAGDVLGCRYRAHDGGSSSVALFVNGNRAFEFEFDGQLPAKPLYVVVDVCYSVYQVSMVNEGGCCSSALMGG